MWNQTIMKHPTALAFFLAPLLFAGVAFGHGGEEEAEAPPATIYPMTQIGLPEASMGHDHGTTSGDVVGHTRDEVAALIRDSQNEENFRSTVRLVFLSFCIIGLLFVFYPRRRPSVAVTGGEGSAQTLPPTNAAP
ncbi:MAG: hypothetical protein Q7S52_02040 [bacterium]|nr:hypothetical protein [bacterium]